MAKLFELSNLRNHVTRNGFDLSKKHAFSAKVGEALPVWWRFTYPGDMWSIRHKHFTRTVPVQTAAFTRIREYFDFFFVPFRLMSKNSSTILTQMTENPVYAKSLSENVPVTQYMPYIDLETLENKTWGGAIGNLVNKKNFFGYDRAHLSAKLLSYLGYGWISDANVEAWNNQGGDEYQTFFEANIPVSIFPLAAYQKICQDFFRNTQWETARPYLYNFDYMPEGGLIDFEHVDSDYWNDNTIFDLNYVNWQKDLFMGILPDSQFGDVSVVDVANTANSISTEPTRLSLGNFQLPVGVYDSVSSGGFQQLKTSNSNLTPSSGSQVTLGVSGASDSITQSLKDMELIANGTNQYVNIPSLQANIDEFKSSFNILQLRQAEFLQRWKEIAQSGSQDYREQIYKHFGVRIPATLSYLCQYLGGDSSDVIINEVVNQSLADESKANIKGKGVGSGKGKIKFKCKEYGVIMCIYHATPLLDYSLNAQALELDYIEATDFPIPEFDKIGMQELPVYYFNNSRFQTISTGKSPLDTWGYVPRYSQLKTDVDVINGVFKTSKPDWVAPMSAKYFEDYFNDENGVVSYKFFKVNPALLDSIFGVDADDKVDSDQLLINSYFDVRAVRNYDYDGMPY